MASKLIWGILGGVVLGAAFGYVAGMALALPELLAACGTEPQPRRLTLND